MILADLYSKSFHHYPSRVTADRMPDMPPELREEYVKCMLTADMRHAVAFDWDSRMVTSDKPVPYTFTALGEPTDEEVVASIVSLPTHLGTIENYTNFYCDPGSGSVSQLNSGSTDAAPITTTTGDWDGTSVYTCTGTDNPTTLGIAVNDFVSIYVTSGATVATFLAQVTAVTNAAGGTVTVSTTIRAGTVPASSAGAHTMTLKDGGPWKGPNAADAFPFNLAQTAGALSALKNGSAPVRINIKNSAQYNITAGIACSQSSLVIEGYQTTVGDGNGLAINVNTSQAVIDGGATNAHLWNQTGTGVVVFKYITFQHNATGNVSGLVLAANGLVHHCIANNIRNAGFYASGTSVQYIECESYSNNLANLANYAGFYIAAGAGGMAWCFSHNNTGTNANGLTLAMSLNSIFVVSNSIFANNGTAAGVTSNGITVTAGNGVHVMNCDFYNNALNGIEFITVQSVPGFIQNSNFCNNGNVGVKSGAAPTSEILLTNCGFGTGTAANTNGRTTTASNVQNYNYVDYASNVTPWNAPSTGDFTITLTAAKDAGRGAFVETGNSMTGTIPYVNLGASPGNALSGGVTHLVGYGGGLVG